MGKEEIWIALRNRGYSAKAAAVIIGHAAAESGCEANRVQGDFAASRDLSRLYTAQVDKGEVDRTAFARHGPCGGGYGLLQWTYPTRKEGLYDTAKRLGVSVGSEKAAVEWLDEELHQAEYAAVLAALRSDGSVREISDVFMHRFERPADQSESACAFRARLAQTVYDELGGVSLDGPTETGGTQNEETGVNTEFWPPRTVDETMEGPDVQLYQAALLCHGYSVMSVSGLFDESTTRAVKAFQTFRGLKVDGVIGPITGKELLSWD